MVKDILYNFKKTVLSLYFLISILLVCTLCFTSVAYVTETMQEYNVLECILFLGKEDILADSSLCNLCIFQNSLNGYLSMFLPMLVSFPFVYSYCQERKSGLIRMAIIRTSKRNYIISKFIVAFFDGALIVLLGYALYGGLIGVLFPSPKDYGISMAECILNGTKSILSCIGIQMEIAALYGAISTCFTLVLISVLKNEYILCSLPFLALYIDNVTVNKIIDWESAKGVDHIYANFFSPEAITNLGRYEITDKMNLIKIIIIYVVLSFVLYFIGMNKRWDYGE